MYSWNSTSQQQLLCGCHFLSFPSQNWAQFPTLACHAKSKMFKSRLENPIGRSKCRERWPRRRTSMHKFLWHAVSHDHGANDEKSSLGVPCEQIMNIHYRCHRCYFVASSPLNCAPLPPVSCCSTAHKAHHTHTYRRSSSSLPFIPHRMRTSNGPNSIGHKTLFTLCDDINT